MNPHLHDVLTTRFGLQGLYPVQGRIIDSLMNGRNALVVLPTGSGKSLCYQLPALALPGAGVVLVFSPLIALMEDQVASLKSRGIRAEFINSTLSRAERENRYAALARGEYELIYATPERMYKNEFAAALEKVPGGVKLLAIDEAHCIARWGHDFRPAYQQVGHFRRALGTPTTVALTATATPAVREDIRRTLGVDAETMPLFATGIDRPNLTFAAKTAWKSDAKMTAICDVASKASGTGIVYFTLIKSLELAAAELRRKWGKDRVDVYHGQLRPERKKSVYDRFTRSRPQDGLMLLATNAFGMGVDKPDIRYIVHAQIPGSVEAYYQEVGRAGRDGRPAECILLYDESDLAIQQEFIEWKNPSADLLINAARTFEESPHATLGVEEVREAIVGRDRGDRRAEYCVITLEKMGVIAPAAIPDRFELVRPIRDEELDPEGIAEKRGRDLRRLLDIVQLTRADDIREFVLDYFALS